MAKGELIITAEELIILGEAPGPQGEDMERAP